MEKFTTNIEPFQGAKPTNLERFIWLLERAFYRPMGILQWHYLLWKQPLWFLACEATTKSSSKHEK
jgi:hypothetical protein